jgi:NDP-4-keto-2,6-dideoxyhexose 3-C-methyltransferase
LIIYNEIKSCRICGNQELDLILELETQALTGIFPNTKTEEVPAGPLSLVKCRESNLKKSCGLVQLKESYNAELLYGKDYGYRSGLNKSMVQHLNDKVKNILNYVTLSAEDIILDIGSNDSTLLQAYPKDKGFLVGFDPTGIKFKKFYPDHITLITDFFNSKTYKQKFGDKKAKIITSIAMFYDLENPLEFVREVHDILSDDGVWVLEQSYMPSMLEVNAFDTICHEHLEYYRLKQIHWMMKKVGFKIIDIEFNKINGGSFSVTVAKLESSFLEMPSLEKILLDEQSKALDTMRPYEEFKNKVFKFRVQMREFLNKIHTEKKTILGYGASTKGNVILNFCGITSKDIPYIAEVNTDKFNCYTPGTLIPIISEQEARKMDPDYFLVFPWHFKDFILKKERATQGKKIQLVFPLPFMEVC